MGTTYYLARLDNHTLYDMDRAFGLEQLMSCSDTERVDFCVLYLALLEWFGSENANHVRLLMAAIQGFAQGQPVYFVTEHHPWFDGGEWHDDNRLRVVGYRDDIYELDERSQQNN